MSAALAIIEYQQQLLFLQRSQRTSRASQWCLPGGRIHQHESPESACLREVREETALVVTPKQLVLQTSDCYYFSCQLLQLGPVLLNPRESSDFAWVRPKRLLKLGYIMDFHTLIPLLRRLGYRL